jgi:hypothetical protein
MSAMCKQCVVDFKQAIKTISGDEVSDVAWMKGVPRDYAMDDIVSSIRENFSDICWTMCPAEPKDM